MRRAVLAVGVLIASMAALPHPLAQSDDPASYGDGYQAGDYGRIRYLENGSTMVRADNGESDQFGGGPAVANSPVTPGDTLREARDQRAEVQLANGTILRIDRDSEVTFQALPRSGAAYKDNTVLSLSSGTLRIVGRVAEGEDFRVDTPACSVYLLGDGDVRIDVESGGTTRVLSRRGVVEVVGEGGSVLVRGGMKTKAEPGVVPSEPRSSNTFSADGFDRWCDARDDVYRTPTRYAVSGSEDDQRAYDAAPPEVRPYYGELDAYGSWTSVPDYGWVWCPEGVSAGWRPYWDGYWDYGPEGYFWISNEPWGWAPYHYGRWSWVASIGWCWAPGHVFGGAWVSWSWGAAYVGWSPLDYWNRPACVSPYQWGYYDPHSWTFVGYDNIAIGRPYPRYAVPVSSIAPTLRGGAIVTRPPRISPRLLSASHAARSRAADAAAGDVVGRLRPAPGDPSPRLGFTNLERRMPAAGGRSPDPARARGQNPPRSPGAGVGRPNPPGFRRDGGLPSDGSKLSPGSPPRGGAGRLGAPEPRGTTTHPSGDARGRADRSPAAPPESRTPRATPRGGDRAESNPGGYPRRFLSDPRGSTSAPGRGAPEARPGRGSAAAPPASGVAPRYSAPAPQETRERVRDMYERMARPRETQNREDPRALRPPSPRYQQAPPPRVERRAPPAAPQPHAAPGRAQPPARPQGRAEPQRSRGGGGEKRHGR